MNYLIWSIEHDAWWKPGWHGYTSDINEAGMYSKDEAERIVKNANAHGSFNECMIPQECTEP